MKGTIKIIIIELIVAAAGFTLAYYLLTNISRPTTVAVERTADFTIYIPQGHPRLAVETMPKWEDSVDFCCAAAFCGDRLDTFDHKNIAGNHVVDGKLFEGYPCRTNTGLFCYYNGKWHFAYARKKDRDQKYKPLLNSAAKYPDGMAFGQIMVIYNGKKIKGIRWRKSKNVYRCLCEKEGRLMIVESNHAIEWQDFVERLHAFGVRHAISLDMGSCSAAYYNDSTGLKATIHGRPNKHYTNWLYFKNDSRQNNN